MATNYSRRTAVPLAAFAVIGSIASAQVPSPATLNITNTGKSGVSITVNDPSNYTWSILSSTNYSSWSEAARLKVFNGNFHTNFPNNPAMPLVLYRAMFNAAEPAIADTTAAALLLHASPFNYANPEVRASYLVPPISQEDNTPSTNATTDAGATLGRALFYDKRLSTNQTISCASCHQQAHGFADPRQFSAGYNGSLGTRNAMSLNDAKYYQRGHFFWDERANTLEDQVLMPIQNPVEMGMTLPALLPRLAVEPYYTNLFALAFGTTDVTTNRVSLALAQFVRSIVSTNSKYDLGVPLNFSNFTAQENQGRQIFIGVGNCVVCHTLDTFAAGNIFNNGLEYPYVDTGVGGITGRSQDMGLFKVPSLRNIALTAPYMHDGRFATLDQVVAFYNSAVVANPNLSPPLRLPNGTAARLNLTAAQQAALVAFLNTLTDTTLTSDPKFSDPFNYGN